MSLSALLAGNSYRDTSNQPDCQTNPLCLPNPKNMVMGRPLIVLTSGLRWRQPTLLDDLPRDPVWLDRPAISPVAGEFATAFGVSSKAMLFQRLVFPLHMSLESGERSWGNDQRRNVCHMEPYIQWRSAAAWVEQGRIL